MNSLDRDRKDLGLSVIGLGLCTLFLPLVIVDPPVMNRTEWSPLNIARAVYERSLPARGGQLEWGPGGLLDIALGPS
jgi:hypothetical protein